MSNLDTLLQGVDVEWKTLCEIALISAAGVDKKIINTENPVTLLNYMDVYRNPYLNAKTPTMRVTANDAKLEQCNVLKGDIFITPSSEVKNEIGFSAMAVEDMPDVVYSYHIMRIRLNEYNLTQSMFINYLFRSNTLQSQINKQAKGLTRFGLTKTQWENLQIPIPPLPVQKEIVRILDTFTKLTAKLTAELTARKKQYEYYREQLLSFEDGEVEWKTLGELGEFYGGLTGKSKDDFSNGNAKFITYMNVFSNIAVNTNINTLVKIGHNEKQNKVEYGDVLFTGSSETPHECGMSSVMTTKTDEEFYLNSFCFGFRLNDKTLFLPNFLKYLFRDEKTRKQIAKTASGVTRYNVSKARFAKISIPIPPLAEQASIVSILDKFDTLTTSISEGLPKEIELREKQYEYYRDMLLTFPNDKIKV